MTTKAELENAIEQYRDEVRALNLRIAGMDRMYDDLVTQIKVDEMEQKIKRMKLKRRIRRLTRAIDINVLFMEENQDSFAVDSSIIDENIERLSKIARKFGSK